MLINDFFFEQKVFRILCIFMGKKVFIQCHIYLRSFQLAEEIIFRAQLFYLLKAVNISITSFQNNFLIDFVTQGCLKLLSSSPNV